MKIKVSDYVVEFLKQKGIAFVFEMSGGMIAHLLDSLSQVDEVKVISMHHEQGAAFAADAFGRMTGIPGVAMATSGPGATNLLTGIGSCHFDSTPAIFITGQVNTYEQKGDRAIRQLGFQETDIVSMVRNITKAAWLANTPEEVPQLLEKAWQTAMSGRPGPVLIDIPMDVQRATIDAQPVATAGPAPEIPAAAGTEAFLASMTSGLKEAKRPLILAGGGVRSSHAVELFRRFSAMTGIPVVCSLMGVDILPYENPLRVGMIGSYGNRWANHALAMSDFLIVLGSRLDVRQTGSDTETFKEGRRIFHVDCEPGEMNNRVTGCETLAADLTDFLGHALRFIQDHDLPAASEWMSEIGQWREEWADTREVVEGVGINPNAFMHALSQMSASAAAYVVDVGQHQMWAAQSLELGGAQRFLTSGGMGSMGFALPAAIGAALVCDARAVVVIAGDGGFQSNIQELQTVVRNRLPLKMVVINNLCHGMVRQFQESYFDARYQSTMWGYSSPDFSRVAEAYGISGKTIQHPEEIDAALHWLWSDPSAPALLQVMVNPMANAYPKLAFGKPLTEMEPFSKPIDMEST
jgi:acetolactate synthase-1/2/3 large subunit